jgi:hypothetical protein
MKKALFLFVFMSLMCHSFSQGNLQFNRVLSLTNGSNSSVPTGKVWKVESVNLSSTVNFPIWLEAGKNITIANGTGVLVSIIEFNVIP